VNLAQECAFNKACFKPVCFIIWLQFGLPIHIDLTRILQSVVSFFLCDEIQSLWLVWFSVFF
jgi:hypothetical protein